MEAAIIASAVASVTGGLNAMGQAKLQSQAAKEQADIARLQAMDEENMRQEELRKSLASQRAAAAALGFDPNSSLSFSAIRDTTIRQAEDDVRNIRLNGAQSVRNAKLSGREAMAAGYGSLIAGFGRAAGTAMSYSGSGPSGGSQPASYSMRPLNPRGGP